MSERSGKAGAQAAGGRSGGRRKKSLYRRIRHRVKRSLYRHKWLGFSIVIAAGILLALGLWMLSLKNQQSRYHISAKSQIEVSAGYRSITYNGKSYRYNNRVTTILYAGVDSVGELKATKKYTIAPRADSIMLLVLDEYHGKLTVIGLNRDTMTGIHRYTLNGRDRGLYEDHLGYAYTYGDGGEVSCRNLCRAVSDLLGGIPINEYMVNNVSALSALGDMIGPVRVSVPNDDLEALGYTRGMEMDIDGSNLEMFIRSRDTAEDLSNVGRMERQRAYVRSAMRQFADSLKEDPREVWEKIQSVEQSVEMSVTRNRYLDLAGSFGKVSIDESSFYSPEGEHVVGKKHDEFYPDLEKLREKVIELFYLEQ